jgi:ElaB/YqjD/DUF883 family membrane-anchored ribosome-binding protein
MTTSSDQNSQDLAREADESRAQLASTLDTLKERLTPGQIFDEMFEGSGQNANRMLRNLGAALRDNPIPAVLVGAGIAMWATGIGSRLGKIGGKGSGDHGRQARSDAHFDRGEGWNQGRSPSRDAQSTPSGLVDKARDVASSVGDAMSGAGERVGQIAHDARDGLGSTMDRISDAGSAVGRQASGLSNLVTDQPLLAAAIGMAAGAVLGAALPATRLEGEWMGEAGEALRDSAGDFVSDQLEAVKNVARTTAGDIVDEAKAQGLTTESARDTAGTLGDRVAAVADKAADSLKREVRDKLGPSGNPAKSATPNRSGQVGKP